MVTAHRAERVQGLDLPELTQGGRLGMVNGNSPAEVEIDESLVRALLGEQCPVLDGVDTSSLALAPFSNGWDNDIWALGDKWLVRLPRRDAAAELVVNEQRWLPVLAPRLSLLVPVPVFAGAPSDAYPWHWSVVPRFEGEVAARSVLVDPEREAERMAHFLRELHVQAPSDAPVNPYRGIPVTEIAAKYRIRRDRQRDRLVQEGRDVAALDQIVDLGVQAPLHEGVPVWLHGDMHLGNLLVDSGTLSAVIDWGDVCGGDSACDLQIAWMLFDADARDVFFGAYGEGSRGLWERARAWAAHSALVYLDNDGGDPLMSQMANVTLGHLLA